MEEGSLPWGGLAPLVRHETLPAFLAQCLRQARATKARGGGENFALEMIDPWPRILEDLLDVPAPS